MIYNNNNNFILHAVITIGFSFLLLFILFNIILTLLKYSFFEFNIFSVKILDDYEIELK